MKNYEITLKSDSGLVTFGYRANSIQEAQQAVCAAEKAPLSAIHTWRVIPTAKQISKTKNMLRSL